MLKRMSGGLLALMLLSTSTVVFAELPIPLQGLGLREDPVAQRDTDSWKKPQKILVWAFSDAQLQSLQAVAPGVELVGARNVDEARELSADVQAVIGFCDARVLDPAVSLHWVQTYWAGVERCVGLAALQRPGMVLSNGQRLSSPAIADYAIAMMLALARDFGGYHRKQLESTWKPEGNRNPGRFDEIEGGTMLVVGLGGIGSQVARRANALGMRVIATRGSRREGPAYVDYVGLSDEAVELAKQADVVVNAAPLTPQTRGMFNAAFFQAMKPSAYFISVGRGKSTVTDDLVKALRSGAIAGAALDVTEPEPLPEDHPLWSMPQVLITPHVSAQTAGSMQRVMVLVTENLRRYVAGDALLSVVDIKRGY
jgi:phosphoglycerate dehydrogenase-like enzyme